MKPHILFYDDYYDVGGHEVMTVEAVRALAPTAQISFMLYERNTRLRELLGRAVSGTSAVEIIPIPYRSWRLQETRSLLSLRANFMVQSKMKRLRPDLVVVAQGRIELSSLGILAAKAAALRTVSYLPLAHPLKMAGLRLGSSVRECIDWMYYRLPGHFITCTPATMAEIKKHNPHARVIVVPNGIDISKRVIGARTEARAALGIPNERYVVSVVGRINLRDKGQGNILRAFARNVGKLGNSHLLFVGDGPDTAELARQIRQSPCSDRVTMHPWMDDVSPVYAASDMVALPSRFEGFPLVLLEAMYHGLPVIASRVDAMADVLPQEWLFEFGDDSGVVKALLNARSCSPSLLAANRQRVVSEHTLDRFHSNFRAATNQILGID